MTPWRGGASGQLLCDPMPDRRLEYGDGRVGTCEPFSLRWMPKGIRVGDRLPHGEASLQPVGRYFGFALLAGGRRAMGSCVGFSGRLIGMLSGLFALAPLAGGCGG